MRSTIPAEVREAFGLTIEECASGLASGESVDDVGVTCDFLAGFVPGVGSALDARDGYFVVEAVANGKETTGDYVKGAFAAIGIAASAFPLVRPARQALSAAGDFVRGTRAQRLFAREVLARARRLVAGEADEGVSIGARTLSNPSIREQTKLIMAGLLGGCVVEVAGPAIPDGLCRAISKKTLNALDNLGKRLGDARMIDLVGRLQKKFSDEAISKLLRTLDRAEFRSMSFSDEAMEGLTVFMQHTISERRLSTVLKELIHPDRLHLPAAQAQQIIEQLGRNLKSMDDKIEGLRLNVPAERFAELGTWWHNFIARGAGTSSRFGSTRGFMHALENTLPLDPRQFVALDTRLAGYSGRPDLVFDDLVDGIARRLQLEFKNTRPGELLRGNADKGEIAQLLATVGAAVARARVAQPQGGVAFRNALSRELSQTICRFRSAEKDHPGLRKQIQDLAEGALGPQLAHLAVQLSGRVEFKGSWPF